MINQLASEIVLHTQDYAQLQKMVSQAESVRDTVTLLDEISSQLRKWADVFTMISPLIASDSVEAIHLEAARIGRQLAVSRDEFVVQNFQQATKLTQLKSRVERLRSITKDAWCEYARETVAPYNELALIAERLPKMARHLEAIYGYLATVQKQSDDLPSKPEAVEQFHAHIGRLETLLSDLEGLPSDVRVFLDKLMKGEASMVHVTQTVFDWCRAEGLADKLRIARL